MARESVVELPLIGNIPPSWRKVEFGSVLEGGTRNGIYKSKEFHGRGVKIVNMGELFAHPRLRDIEMERVELTEDEIKRFGLFRNDLLFARRSLVAEGAGKCCIVLEVNEPTTFESSIIRARPYPKDADSLFLFYLFNSPFGKYSLDCILRHVAVAGITGSDLMKIPIPLPSLSEQRAIAHILGTLDDKIELNRRMNEKLEAMALTIFKSWFVDFDPGRKKAEGRDPFLPKAIADLFPERFEKTALEDIPAEWKVGTLSDIATLVKEPINPLGSPNEEFLHFSIPAFDEGQQPKRESGAAIKSLKFRVPDNVVLISKLNPEIERVWLVDVGTLDRAVCSTEFLVLRPKPPFNRSYLYCLTRSPEFRSEIEGLVTGTSKSHQRAQADAVLDTVALLPQPKIVKAFGDVVAPLLDRTLANKREMCTLAAMRDDLLPKLISGELRVNDPERFVAEANL